jgi:hypothetical protein
MPLVPGSLRRPAIVLLAACVVAIAVTGVRFPGYGLPGWLDATFDPRFEAQQGGFPCCWTGCLTSAS